MVVTMVMHRLKAGLLFLINIIKRSLCCFRRRRKSSVDSVPLTTIGIIPNNPTNNHLMQDAGGWKNWEEDGSLTECGGDGFGADADEHDYPGGGHHDQELADQQQQQQQQPAGVQYHIEQYRRQTAAKYYTRTAEQPQEQPQDFFQDMEPEIKRQTKMLVKVKVGGGGGAGGGRRASPSAGPGSALLEGDNAAAAARLACHHDHFIPTEEMGELGSWDDGDDGRSRRGGGGGAGGGGGGGGSSWSDAELGWDMVLRQHRKMERHQRRTSSGNTPPDARRSTLGATKIAAQTQSQPAQS